MWVDIVLLAMILVVALRVAITAKRLYVASVVILAMREEQKKIQRRVFELEEYEVLRQIKERKDERNQETGVAGEAGTVEGAV